MRGSTPHIELIQDYPNFGVERFTYTKGQVQQIWDLLTLNDNRIDKVFSVVWNDRVFDTRNPTLVVDLVYSVWNNKTNGKFLTFENFWENRYG